MGEKSNKSIVVRTSDTDTYIPFQLNQEFDFINIMSLKITQDGLYSMPNAGYGVIVGRVVVNGGLGVPNVKVTIFIPIDEKDIKDEVISYIYPYKTPNDKNSDGIRYNLLPKTKQHNYHTPVGTFPNQEELFADEKLDYVYKKYYKYVTTTNSVGDYMIMGVPTGEQTIFMDCDVSDIGALSQKPYDFMKQGYGETLFASKTRFNQSLTIETLPQVFSQVDVIDVKPFWGLGSDLDSVGINKKNFTLNYKLVPTCFFIGSMGKYSRNFEPAGEQTKDTYIDADCHMTKFKISQGAEHPWYVNLFNFSNVIAPGGGRVEVSILNDNGIIEYVSENGGYVVDGNGVWCIQIPMKSGWKITSESGALVDSVEGVGIPTYSNVRIRYSTEATNDFFDVQDAYFISPSINNDFRFTKEDYVGPGNSIVERSFNGERMEWNKIYTVKNTIGNYCREFNGQYGAICNIEIGNRNGVINPFPLNVYVGDIISDPYNSSHHTKIVESGYSFSGVLNGFMFFTPFKVNDGTDFCNCKAGYPRMTILVINDNYTHSMSIEGGIGLIEQANSGKYYNYTNRLVGGLQGNSNTSYCGIVEIGEMDNFIDKSDELPNPTSYNGGALNQIGTSSDWVITKKQYRVNLMQKATGFKYVTDKTVENRTWFDYSNHDNPNYLNFMKTPNSFSHYYGLIKNKTAIDVLKNEYIKVK